MALTALSPRHGAPWADRSVAAVVVLHCWFMAHDEELAERIRDLLDEPRMTEKRMFGGLAFLISGNMALAASGQGGVLVRVDLATSDALVDKTHADGALMRDRPMQGWSQVAPEHLRTMRQLAKWVEINAEELRRRSPVSTWPTRHSSALGDSGPLDPLEGGGDAGPPDGVGNAHDVLRCELAHRAPFAGRVPGPGHQDPITATQGLDHERVDGGRVDQQDLASGDVVPAGECRRESHDHLGAPDPDPVRAVQTRRQTGSRTT